MPAKNLIVDKDYHITKQKYTAICATLSGTGPETAAPDSHRMALALLLHYPDREHFPSTRNGWNSVEERVINGLYVALRILISHKIANFMGIFRSSYSLAGRWSYRACCPSAGS
jgi:hypothetical protein